MIVDKDAIIQQLLDHIGDCSCHEGYKSRDMVDPSCTRCDILTPDLLVMIGQWQFARQGVVKLTNKNDGKDFYMWLSKEGGIRIRSDNMPEGAIA